MIRIVSTEQLAREREAQARADEAKRKAEIDARTKEAEAQLKEAEVREPKATARAAAEGGGSARPAAGGDDPPVLRRSGRRRQDAAGHPRHPGGRRPADRGHAGIAAPGCPRSSRSRRSRALYGLGLQPPHGAADGCVRRPGRARQRSDDPGEQGDAQLFLRLYAADLERIKKLVREYFDVPLPQVKIEARMEILDRTALEPIGILWGGARGRRASAVATLGGARLPDRPAAPGIVRGRVVSQPSNPRSTRT